MLKKLLGLLARKKEIPKQEVEPPIQMQQPILEVEEVEEDDPWEIFTAVCKKYEVDYSEVIEKAAWSYVEDSGYTAIADPITQIKDLAEAISSIEAALEKLNEPVTLKKFRQYKDTIKELAEFKQAIKELREGKMSTFEMVQLVRDLLKTVR